MSSFILGGKRADELGLVMLRQSQRPVLPGTTDRTLQIPGRHGAWDFGAELGPRLFNLEVAFIERNTVALQRKVSELAAFLVDAYGRPRTMELIFTAQPDRRYFVRYSGTLPIERISGLGRFTLPLIAYDPFAYLETDPILDSDILLDSDIRLDGEVYTFETVTGIVEDTIKYVGTIADSPQITVIGSFDSLSITVGEKTFGFTQSVNNQTLVINGRTMTVTLDGANALQYMTGDFVEFMPGENEVIITGSGLNCDVSISLEPKFV